MHYIAGMGKKLLVLSILVLLPFLLCAVSSKDLGLASQEPVYPSHSLLGQLGPSLDQASALLAKALSQSFDLNWTETYLDETNKKALSLAWSTYLAGFLPQKNFILSPVQSVNDAHVIRVLFQDGSLLDFVIADSIVAIRN